MSLVAHIRQALSQGADPGTFVIYEEVKRHFPDASPNWLRNEIQNLRVKVKREMREAAGIMRTDQ